MGKFDGNKRKVKIKEILWGDSSEMKIQEIKRELTQERDIVSFFMRKGQAEISEKLPNEFRDCINEIEFCFRCNAGGNSYVSNLRAYGYVTSGLTIDDNLDRVAKLMPVYKNWRSIIEGKNKDAWAVAYGIIMEAKTLRAISFELGYTNTKLVGQLFMKCLNEYSVLRGFGDLLGQYKDFKDYYNLYVIGGGDIPYKIGYSKNPRNRLKELQISNPVELSIHFEYRGLSTDITSLETGLHKHFSPLKVRGEWFNAPVNDIIDVAKIMYPKGTEIIL